MGFQRENSVIGDALMAHFVCHRWYGRPAVKTQVLDNYLDAIEELSKRYDEGQKVDIQIARPIDTMGLS